MGGIERSIERSIERGTERPATFRKEPATAPVEEARRSTVQLTPGAEPARARRRGPHCTAAEVAAFVEQVRGPEEDAAAAFVAALLERDVPVEAIYLELLGPAARVLGEQWDDDRCDFVTVTIALTRMHRIVHAAGRRFLVGSETEPEVGRVFLGTAGGDQHSLGVVLVAEFFLRDGWSVSMGTPLGEADMLAVLRDEWFDVVGFSVSCGTRLAQLKRAICRVRECSRNRRVGVLVGGAIFNESPALVQRVGADAMASDASGAPLAGRRLLTRRA